MPVHVVIKRKFKMSQPDTLIPLLHELSNKASAQPGYISTVTLRSTEEVDDFLVISAWESAADWQKWFTSKERRELQAKVDSLIGERTFYEIFEPVD